MVETLPAREAVLPLRTDIRAGLLDPRVPHPAANFGSAGRRRNVCAIFDDGPTGHVIWQPDVYAEARALAERQGLTTVLDIGCGNGVKLVGNFAAPDYRTVGVDFLGSLDRVREAYPERTWIEGDVTSVRGAEALFGLLAPLLPAVIVVSDVVEHLPDPRPMLALVRRLLAAGGDTKAILSTPDRSRLGYDDPNALPGNLAHVREWTLPELVGLMQHAGFEVERAGNTRANQYDEAHTTSFVQLAHAPAQGIKALAKAGLARGSAPPRHLLLTTELHGVGASGGIGTFVEEQRANYGADDCLVLHLGPHARDPSLQARLGYLVPADLLPEAALRDVPPEDQALAAVEQLLFYLPELASVEYQDYLGIGSRIAQARSAGLLPASLTVVAHCHGSTHYLENGLGEWWGSSHFGTAEKEKIAVEGADLVVLPTRFLRNLYEEGGIRLDPARVLIRPYPYHQPFDSLPRRERTNTLVFFGKRSRMKGFDLAVEALGGEDAARWRDLGITRLVIIGPRSPATEVTDEALAKLGETYAIEEHTDLGREAALTKLRDLAPRSVVLMPYAGDNYPFSVLDVVAANCLPLLVHAGGLPEMLPADMLPALVAEPRPEALRAKLAALLGMGEEDLSALRSRLAGAMADRQAAHNEVARTLPAPPPRPVGDAPRLSIVIPFYNTRLDYLEELFWAIDQQTHPPHEVIVVDDASTTENAAALDAILAARPAGRYALRTERHGENRGLAAARNTGLAAAQGEVLVNLDSDDVPLNDFLRDIAAALRLQPEAAAAVPYLAAFEEGLDFNTAPLDAYVYRPLGDGIIASQADNLLGHANSGYRVEALRAVGGWDASDSSMWEDYALFMRLVSSGRHVAVVPRAGCLYRSRPASMARTYRRWPAQRRLARNLSGLPRFEGFRLQALARQMEKMDGRVEALKDSLEAAESALDAAARGQGVAAPRIERLVGVIARERHDRAGERRQLAAIEAAAERLDATLSREREDHAAQAQRLLAELAETREALAEARAQLRRRSVRAVSLVATRLSDYPFVFRALRWGGRRGVGLARTLRRLVR